MGRTSIRGHEKGGNPQLEGEDLGSELMEGNHKRGQVGQCVRIGMKENVK